MHERWEKLLQKLRLRTALVIGVSHLGLAVSIYALIELRASGAPVHLVYTLALGVVGIYSGLVLGLAFVVLPILSWVRTARKLMNWKEWILDELPTILAQVPKWIDAFQEVRGAIFPQSPAQTPGTAPSPAAGPLDTGATVVLPE